MADKNTGGWIKYIAWGSTIATALVGTEVGGYFLGNFLDIRLGTDPWFKLSLMVVGIFLNMGYLVAFFLKQGKADDK